MRSPSPTLMRKCWSAHSDVVPILELLRTEAEDIVDTRTEWLAATSTGGRRLVAGGVTLAGSTTTHVQYATGSATTMAGLVNPYGASVLQCAAVLWDGDVADREVHAVTARLHPNVSGGGVNVVQWRMQAFRLMTVEANWVGGPAKRWHLQPITEAVTATAGTVEADVTFELSSPALVGLPPTLIPDEEGSFPIPGDAPEVSTTVIAIWGIQVDGSPATNVAWVGNDSVSSATVSGGSVRRYNLDVPTEAGQFGPLAFRNSGASNGLPRFTVVGRSYSPIAISETLDLGATPTGTVEFVAEGRARGGSLLFEVYNGSTWVAYTDGDRAGFGATASVPVQQTYDMRVTLTPSTVGSAPIAARMGARWVGLSEIVEDEIIFGEVAWAVDPLTGQSEIPETQITFPLTGRRDYRTLIEDTLASYDPSGLLFRVWVGDPQDARSDWLHIDDFVLDDYTCTDTHITVVANSPLKFLRREVPEATGAVIEPLTYLSDTPADVYEDLLTLQLGVPARYLGDGLAATTPTLSREIVERVQGFEAARDVAHIVGHAIISSQGRIKAVDMYGPAVPDMGDLALLTLDESAVVGFSPGYRSRVTSAVVKYGWVNSLNSFAGSERAENVAAINALGRASIDFEEQVPDELCTWIETREDAAELAARYVETFGAGLKKVRVTSSVLRPWLEPGDAVAVECDQFVGRDPETGRSIRGPMVAVGRVASVNDWMGSDLDVWVRAWEDIVADELEQDVDGFAPERYALSNFREVARDETNVTYRAAMGSALTEVYVYSRLVMQPVTVDPWPTPDDEDLMPIIVLPSAGEMEITLPLPAEQYLRYVQFDPKDASGRTLGPVYRLIMFPVGDVAKTVYWAISVSESAGVGTLRIAVTDPDNLLHATTPIGFDLTEEGVLTTNVAPSRTIAVNTWERDIPLHPKHVAIIEPVLHLATGGVIRPGAETFDIDKIAHIENVRVSNDDMLATILVDGDTDTAGLYYQEQVPDEDGFTLEPEEEMDERDSNPRLGFIVVERDVTRRRTFFVYGKNDLGEEGPRVEVEVDKFEMSAGAGPGAAASLDFVVTDDGDCGTEDPAMVTVSWEWFVTAGGFTATLEREVDGDPWDMRVAGLLITPGVQSEVDQFEGYENDPLGASSVRVRYRVLTVRTTDDQVVAVATTAPIFLDLQACP
jgi:hypothetical protein